MTSVTPEASAPRISARWEMDLSPGARTRPESEPARLAVKAAAVIVKTKPPQASETERGIALTAVFTRGKGARSF